MGRKYALYWVIMDKQAPYVTCQRLATIPAPDSSRALLKAICDKIIPDAPITKGHDYWFMTIRNDDKTEIWVESRTNQFWHGDLDSCLTFGTELTECIYS
jgi:hypothetical protein